MALQSKLMAVGQPAAMAAQTAGDVAANLTAAGTTQTDALQLSCACNYVTTVASGAGVRLPGASNRPANIGDECVVYNHGANALSVYPPSGEQLYGQATNAAWSLGTYGRLSFKKVTNTLWIPAEIFTASGSGAFSRDTQGKLREIEVSITDFTNDDGTQVATTVSDNSTGIQKALNTAKRIVIPDGTFGYATGLTYQGNGQEIVGRGKNSILSYTGAGTALSFNAKSYCSAEHFQIVSTTGAIGIDIPALSHNFRLHRLTIDGQSAAVPTGFTTAAVRGASSFYGAIDHCDIIYSTIGISGFNQFNGNFITKNSIRQCKTGIKITDTTGSSSGTLIIGNEIESAATGSLYAIQLLGTQSMVVVGNRLEYTVGTSHVNVDLGTGNASFNQFIGNAIEGTIAAYVLGDGTGSSQVIETMIVGGRAAGAITINADCDNTQITAAPASYGGSLTDNGSGSVVLIDSVNSKWYVKQGTDKKFSLVAGGSGTIIDVGGTNYLDIKNPVGTHTRFETAGLLRVAQGSVAAGGDSGGTASCNTLSSVSDLTANSTGTGTILFKGATNRNSSGFIKIYIGTTAYYVPVFSAITG